MRTLLPILLLSCRPEFLPKIKNEPPDPTVDDTAGPTGAGLFRQGCPEEGRAAARVLIDEDERPIGDDAMAAPGDVLLLSTRAAYVIQGTEDPRSYYHYGGIPIDAVAVEGCGQASPERLGEVGFVVGRLNLTDFQSSSLRQVRGEAIRIVSDGADGGPAVVEVDATDDRFWLVELTLVRGAYEDGHPRTLGPLYGLDITIRYTLHPDSAVLLTEVLLDGEPVEDGFLVGALLFPSDRTPLSGFTTSELSVGGFGLDLGLPWVSMGKDEGSIALAMPGASAALTTIAGVTAVVDTTQAAIPLQVGGAAEPPAVPFLFAVGPRDPASASAELEPYLANPLIGRTTRWQSLSGRLVDPAGEPVPDATIDLLAPDDGGEYRVLERLVTDAQGRFAGRSLDIGQGWRLRARAEGRDSADPIDVDPSTATGLDLEIGTAGALRVEVVDEVDLPLPARVELEREDGHRVILYAVPGDAPHPVPPGRYTAWVSRGYEHAIATTTVEVPEGGEASLPVSLPRLVDTTGWASFDSHVHAEPSPDSTTLPADRMRTAAAAGLDAVISTDHEAIVDLSWALEEAGVADWLGYALGSEVTATVPEHTNAWPFPPRPGHPRGEPVRWYEMGFPGIYAAERDRGARVVQLNHARVNGECGILCVLDWDRMSETPSIEDPTLIGLPAGTEVWSWDFDSFEVMNGLRSPFLRPEDPRRSGALIDWLSFFNLGHRVTGVAVTDIHGADIPGSPRTWVALDDDSPGAFVADDLADSVLAGAAQLSAGAFARVSANGAGPGELADTPDGVVDLQLQIEALPEIDLSRVEVLVDCDAALSVPASDPVAVVKLDETVRLELERDAYIVIIGMGEGSMPRGLDDYDASSVPRVVTNPIFVDVDGDGAWTAPGPKSCSWAP